LKKLLDLISKYKLWLLALLKPLGFWGVGLMAFVDAAALPIPIDLIIAGYIWRDARHFYLYVVLAAAGSALGALVPYFIGRAGGELFLMKRINRKRYESLRDRFERQEFLAIMIPSMLPPPTPWKPFVFGAGVFEMKTVNFLLAVFVGRVLRNLVTAGLTIKYGPSIIVMAQDLATRHRTVLLAVLIVLCGLLAAWVVRKRVRKRGVAKKKEGRAA
jgi:membrane protein YqaA with SNARE-associated domain